MKARKSDLLISSSPYTSHFLNLGYILLQNLIALKLLETLFPGMKKISTNQLKAGQPSRKVMINRSIQTGKMKRFEMFNMVL